MPRKPAPVPRSLTRLRKICLSFAEAHEVEAWGAPTFRLRNKLFAMYAAPGNHHGGGRPAVWIKARSTNQDLLVHTSPTRYFVPPYVGPSGWIGAWLDSVAAWDEVRELLRDGYDLIAPKRPVRAPVSTPKSRRATATPTRRPVSRPPARKRTPSTSRAR